MLFSSILTLGLIRLSYCNCTRKTRGTVLRLGVTAGSVFLWPASGPWGRHLSTHVLEALPRIFSVNFATVHLRSINRQVLCHSSPLVSASGEPRLFFYRSHISSKFGKYVRNVNDRTIILNLYILCVGPSYRVPFLKDVWRAISNRKHIDSPVNSAVRPPCSHLSSCN
jgi:hypothetical protein